MQLIIGALKLAKAGNEMERPILKGFIVIAIISLVSISYWPILSAGYIWDDDNYVTNNPTLNSWQGLKDIWLKPGAVPQYYPLVHTTYWLEYRLWGHNPLGFHIVNIILHILNVIVLWRILKKLHLPWAILTCILFAIHPINVESVAWITERKNVLSGLLYLIALNLYIDYLRPIKSDYKRNNRSSIYLLVFAFYLGALLSKTIACSLPMLIIILQWWQGIKIEKKTILAILPFFIVGLIMALITINMEHKIVGAVGKEWQFSLTERFLIASHNWWFYPYKLIWPETLIFFYPQWQVNPGDIRQYLCLLFFILSLLTTIYCLKFGNKAPVTMMMAYTIMIFPALGFINVYPMRYSFVADHFLYLAGIPLITSVVAGIQKVYIIMGYEIKVSKFSFISPLTMIQSLKGVLPYFPIVVVLIVLSFLSWVRCHAFQSEEKLWLDTIAKNRTAWMAHNNLGLLLESHGSPERAVLHYQEAIKIKPDHAGAYANLASAWGKLGNHQQTLENYKLALSHKPNDIHILNNLGNYLSRTGDWEKAIMVYLTALKLNPNSLDLHNNIGNAYAASGNITKAIIAYNNALKINANSFETHYNLAIAYQLSSEIEKAISHCRIALTIKPEYPPAIHKLELLNSYKK